jgi:hypothetical protein
MLTAAEYYRSKAAQCRRLAGALLDADQIGQALLALARELDAMAVQAETAELERTC